MMNKKRPINILWKHAVGCGFNGEMLSLSSSLTLKPMNFIKRWAVDIKASLDVHHVLFWFKFHPFLDIAQHVKWHGFLMLIKRSSKCSGFLPLSRNVWGGCKTAPTNGACWHFGGRSIMKEGIKCLFPLVPLPIYSRDWEMREAI